MLLMYNELRAAEPTGDNGVSGRGYSGRLLAGLQRYDSSCVPTGGAGGLALSRATGPVLGHLVSLFCESSLRTSRGDGGQRLEGTWPFFSSEKSCLITSKKLLSGLPGYTKRGGGAGGGRGDWDGRGERERERKETHG